MEKIVIVGAGLVGSLHAILMAKLGFKVEVYERRPDMRYIELKGGRSINLALSTRGWKALAMAGMTEQIEAVSIPMYGRKMHAQNGELSYQAYGKENQAIYSVSRGDLNKKLLLEASTYENVSFFFNHKCLDIDLNNTVLHFEDENGVQKKVEASRIFGTDGAFSAVRNRMMRNDLFNYSQQYLKHGYKELLLPANPDGTHKIDKNVLHIWPRGEYMLIALPNFDGSYTCTLFFPFDGKHSFNALKTNAQVEAFFHEVFPDFAEIMPELANEYFQNPTSSLAIIRCEPWNYEDKVLLMGDASHAIVPFYGQGMNAGFEDCSVFQEMFAENNSDWLKLFNDFSAFRKPDGDAIADLALQNYIEMRDLVGNADFLLRKKIERKIFDKYPSKWMPLYSQVTFSHIRYSEALAAGKRQDKIMDEIMAIPNIHAIWDSENVESKILEKLNA
jgi:kynurenine 3-monooxygenase